MSAAPNFQRALQQDRERYNQQFKLAQASRPNLDGRAFALSLRSWVAPLVEAIAAIDPERVEVATAELYEVALGLLLGGHFPSPDQSQALDQLWTEVLIGMADSVCVAPRRVSGALSNAVVYLGRHQAGYARWIAALSEVRAELDDAEDVDTLLRAGQVLAWRCGVAAFRSAALNICAQLPTRVLAACLDWPSSDPEVLQSILTRLRDDPWADPLPAYGPPQLVEVGRVGGFAGLDGHFRSLPIALVERGRIRLIDAEDEYALCADSCGAQLVSGGDLPVLQTAKSEEDLILNRRVLKHRPSGSRIELPGAVRSWTFDGHTAAVCLEASYWVRLYACRPQLAQPES